MQKSPRSPWLHQLKRTRPLEALRDNREADVIIVGGGIAGVMTAYYTLTNTNVSVLLLEADKVAHGATGHNAGQITSYFERPFSSLVEEFGLTLAAEAQGAVEASWQRIEELKKDIGLVTPYWRFTGYAGFRNKEQTLLALENNRLRQEAGLPIERIYVSGEHFKAEDFPEEHRELLHIVPQSYLLSILETENHSYVSALCYDKGCMNSALFTEEVASHLLVTYPGRFAVHEETPVSVVSLEKNGVSVTTPEGVARAGRIVLCTNGFESITIENPAGKDINTGFHHLLEGQVGYMAAFMEPEDAPPTAISYFFKGGTSADEDYYYLTRRPYDLEGSAHTNLLSIGGPVENLGEQSSYRRDHPYRQEEFANMEGFLKENYRRYAPWRDEELFLWHGLMGYTRNRVRLIGEEPKNRALLYNLGCNGVGILPSIYGGWRVSQILKGEKLGPSIFDPGEEA